MCADAQEHTSWKIYFFIFLTLHKIGFLCINITVAILRYMLPHLHKRVITIYQGFTQWRRSCFVTTDMARGKNQVFTILFLGIFCGILFSNILFDLKLVWQLPYRFQYQWLYNSMYLVTQFRE